MPYPILTTGCQFQTVSRAILQSAYGRLFPFSY
nr:MAG TPA: hypothetical protein [Caudoviricetes sp.]DAT18679.1 MAG TPA: hypothetical protein [Caudoviricetes sp.]